MSPSALAAEGERRGCRPCHSPPARVPPRAPAPAPGRARAPRPAPADPRPPTARSRTSCGWATGSGRPVRRRPRPLLPRLLAYAGHAPRLLRPRIRRALTSAPERIRTSDLRFRSSALVVAFAVVTGSSSGSLVSPGGQICRVGDIFGTRLQSDVVQHWRRPRRTRLPQIRCSHAGWPGLRCSSWATAEPRQSGSERI